MIDYGIWCVNQTNKGHLSPISYFIISFISGLLKHCTGKNKYHMLSVSEKNCVKCRIYPHAVRTNLLLSALSPAKEHASRHITRVRN